MSYEQIRTKERQKCYKTRINEARMFFPHLADFVNSVAYGYAQRGRK